MNISKFVAPEILWGLGSMNQVGESAVRLGITKVFVVTDEGVLNSGWVEKALSFLRMAKLEYKVWHNLTTNPKCIEVARAAQEYMTSGCDGLLAVGGGSSIDVAKAIAILATNGGKIADYEGVNKVTKPLPPMVIVPTTAGSGSEVSQFTIIVNKKRKAKMVIVSKSLVPDIAIVDPTVLQTKNGRLTAGTGMDALSHAIEAYVSLAATELTDVQALNAIRLIANNLRESVACSTNLKAKSAMSMASLQAGLSFSNAVLGVTHAMTHQIDALLDLFHGETNGILLPYVMEYNSIACADKYARVAEAFGVNIVGLSKWEAADRAITEVRRLVRDTGIPERLSDVGLTDDIIPRLSENALMDTCLITNPRDCSQEDIVGIYRRAM